MATEAPDADLGFAAPAFSLPGTDGQLHTLKELAGPRGTVIAFICNHCPYVKAALPRLVRDARDLGALGIKVIGINSNDAVAYPEDSFARMVELSKGLSFPYLHDESQSVARAYGAVCTPDFFGFDAALALRYRGRLDVARTDPPPAGAARELYEAMKMIAESGHGPKVQLPSIGCSIKWRAASA